MAVVWDEANKSVAPFQIDDKASMASRNMRVCHFFKFIKELKVDQLPHLPKGQKIKYCGTFIILFWSSELDSMA